MPSTRIAVAAPNTHATHAAAAVAQEGGNAVDAAIAAICVASITEVGIVAPLGGAYVTVWAPGQDPVLLDGYAEMPGRERPAERFGAGLREFDVDYYGGFTIQGGHGAVATPGMFAALAAASTGYGALPWSEVISPAAHVADRGWTVGPASAFYLGLVADSLFGWDPQTRAFLQADDAAATVEGRTIRNGDLAAALTAIARDGVDTLYTGEIAHVIADDMDERGGLLGLADLAAYRVVPRRPLRVPVGDWDVATNAPPSVGGPVLAAMLQILADRRRTTGRTDAADVLDVQLRVLDYRRRVLDSAEDPEAAGHEMGRILAEAGVDGLGIPGSSPDTVHVSAVDETGLACAITTSAGYGSGVTVPGTGLMFNNALGEPELNRRGVHALPPGTRLASNMAPTTARRRDGSVLAIGSPGADRITTALMQVVGGICLDGQPLQVAIDQPRLHVTFDDAGTPRVEYEDSAALAPVVEASGLRTVRHEATAMFFGGVGAAMRHADGVFEAAGDPRRSAATRIL